MKKRKTLGITVILVLLSFMVINSSIRTEQFIANTLLKDGGMQSNILHLHAELTSGSPVSMIMKKHKVDVLTYQQRNQRVRAVSQDHVKFADWHNTKEIRLVPGGQSIGIQLSTKGVLVVGYHLISTKNGESSPGESAGIRVGDVITKINGIPTGSITDVRHIVRKSRTDKPLQLTLIRQRALVKKNLTPLLDRDHQHYQLGLFIRDSASGIGTMTFYDPKSGAYGALGHVISDRDTGQPILVKNGRIVRSTVQAIDRGREGRPGEKIAFFPENAMSIGNVSKNTPFGIYGKMEQNNVKLFEQNGQALPIATAEQVKEGPAKILTVLNGDKVEAFDIRILNSIPQNHPATKGLVIKITDPRLLRATGGIIQGMSGSPIIQNGKLVGAVTHVFVNDPTSGYGVHIEWMIEEAGITNHQIPRNELAG
ncbi:SpoIVB peptidase [Sporolactobacillus kofuensis]|uniref:SpoIVB peptidase n=1 Tax=Sporolactobacillus kofuensis TaxID=269672 RepID=A0ABW1WJM9_9BACL|nr:SpoIVB peptidase [Sporolactobacillus kofuensis]MCO7176606.1 SpoIVB peptidase [Sporolactobacillus kofuensis]